jgi:hypothetical protein
MSNPNKNIYVTLGASNHTEKEREKDDFYATDPQAAELLMEIEDFDGDIWECATGQNHLANVFKEHGYNVRTSDLVQRTEGIEQIDFLNYSGTWDGNIITNPPYKYAEEFVYKAMDILQEGKKLALFLKIQFLEGKKRRAMFDMYPPKKIWVSSSRLLCAKNADFQGMRDGGGSAVAYAWFIWEKGYKGKPIVDWFN